MFDHWTDFGSICWNSAQYLCFNLNPQNLTKLLQLLSVPFLTHYNDQFVHYVENTPRPLIVWCWKMRRNIQLLMWRTPRKLCNQAYIRLLFWSTPCTWALQSGLHTLLIWSTAHGLFDVTKVEAHHSQASQTGAAINEGFAILFIKLMIRNIYLKINIFVKRLVKCCIRIIWQSWAQTDF